MPPAWVARGPAIETISARLLDHLGVVLVGAVGSGRRSLLERWAALHEPLPFETRIIEDIQTEDALHPTLEERLLCCATRKDWAKATRQKIDGRQWAVVSVPPIRQRPALEDRLGTPVTLADLMVRDADIRERLDMMSPDRRWHLTPDWLLQARLGKTLREWLKRSQTRLRRKKVQRVQRRFRIHALLHTEAQLRTLLELDDALSGMAAELPDKRRSP